VSISLSQAPPETLKSLKMRPPCMLREQVPRQRSSGRLPMLSDNHDGESGWACTPDFVEFVFAN